MQLEVGQILEGKVTRITNFGAFVELPGGQTGMVHISEVAPTFVKEIKDHITENQKVKVKVIEMSDNGKISLSIKKAIADNSRSQNNQSSRSFKSGDRNWQGSRRSNNEPVSFEDLMSKFKKASDEKMLDLKRFNENKRGCSPRRGNQQK